MKILFIRRERILLSGDNTSIPKLKWKKRERVGNCGRIGSTFLGARIVTVLLRHYWVNQNNMDKISGWAEQFCCKTVADGVSSPKEELPCLLRFDWPKPIDAESGRGNGLGRSKNKRPETRKIPRSSL
ncbi:hypothetical protein TNCV_3839331 [Trichonephila clavipes]|nr:hypothetical protein TNCV_3839331 [Trichonephila clavipes]